MIISYLISSGPDYAMKHNLEHIKKKIIEFRDQRDWLQFHDPKNLAEAVSIEAAELLENFLWKTAQESKHPNPEQLTSIKNEVADIFIFLISLCDVLEINLLEETTRKLNINAQKYPVEKAKGSNLKYSELND